MSFSLTISAQDAEAVTEEEPKFTPFTGAGRRLDGKPSKHQTSPVPFPGNQQPRGGTNGGKPTTSSTSENSSSRQTTGKLVFGSNAVRAPKEAQKVCESFHLVTNKRLRACLGTSTSCLLHFFVYSGVLQQLEFEWISKAQVFLLE